MSKELNAKDFSEQLGTSFAVKTNSDQPLSLELYEVTEIDASPALEQFSVLFHGPFSPVMTQSTVSIDHPKLGALELFLVPLGPDEKGMRYQAVFNRFRKQGQVPDANRT